MPSAPETTPRTPGRVIPLRPVAKGTATTSIPNRTLRLHPRGDRPWEGRADDHRDTINTEQHGDTFIVYWPRVGALSGLTSRDYVAFHAFLAAPGDVEALTRHFELMGGTPEEARTRAARLTERLVREGWTRTERPQPSDDPLQSAYFTITRYCDLTCPYCYQGLNDRVNTEMTLEQARLVLTRIKRVNPKCLINLTGGEPFSHPRVDEILDLLEELEMTFLVLSNGSFVTEARVQRLKRMKNFQYIQISLDGATAETHELTRGKGHFPKVMAAIHRVIAHQLPFKLAPTTHNLNLEEMKQIGELAIGNGGWLNPNQLKELPHAGLNFTKINLNGDHLLPNLRELNDHLMARFGLARMMEVGQRYIGIDPEVCSVAAPNSTFICGMGNALLDIDWNGDVYPCHLSKGPDLLIGNIFREDFPRIFDRVREKQLRVMSYEIEKCSGCKFGSTCGGGCRAGAWFTYGTFEHHDDLCDVNYDGHLRRLLIGAGVS